MQDVKGKKVFVGLSGGVDSAVSAALLQRGGMSVTGVFIKGWYPPGMPCTWASERRDAMRVAAHLNIPFHTLDASLEYKKGVIDYLLSEYRAGRTPNPDVMCNREVKFGAFYHFAKSCNSDFIATGHYAVTREDKLFRSPDVSKDQSYFLWAIPADALAMTIFPVGALHKEEVRKLAKRFKLPVAEKKDSQGICFLGSVSVEDFLQKEFGSVPGKAIDESGKEVGAHNGALLYTLGERVSLPQGPWYVVKKNIEENVLTVSREHATVPHGGMLTLSDINWFSRPTKDESLLAQYRYHGPLISGHFDEGLTSFIPDASLSETPASGQSLVLYRDSELIGGGILN